MKVPAKRGRPSGYSEQIADSICEHIAQGRSLRSICKDDGMPNLVTVLRWLGAPAHEHFRSQYARARTAAADALVEEILDIADDGSNDWMERNDPDNPGYQANQEHIQRSKLRVDARKWYASKLQPRKYGESQHLEVTGADGGPVQTSIAIAFVDAPKQTSASGIQPVRALPEPKQ